MTLLHTMIIVPLEGLMVYVSSFIPTLFSVFVILILGLAIAKFLYTVLQRLFKELRVDKVADTIGLSGVLHAGGIKHKLSGLISTLVYLIVIIVFLVIAVQALGLMTMPVLFGHLIGYLSHVITAVFILVLGMILAKMVASIIYVVASNMSLPKPKLHERISRWAIVLYTVKMALVELGFGMLFVGTTFHIWFAGVVFAMALAFGLGGRDVATGYLKKKV